MTSTTRIQRSKDSPLVDHERAFANKLMEMLAIPAFVLDTQCRVMIWNRACERLTGMPAHEIVGTTDHWRSFYDERRPTLADLVVMNRTDEIHQLYPRAASPGTGAMQLCAESWCDMPRVGRRYLATDASPIFDDGGKLLAVV